MDTFMDKLAQKLNAQEMIRANSAADAEEMGKLRNQVAEYNECLAKMQKLLDEGAQKLDGAQVNGEEINRLVEESIAKIGAMQKDTESIEHIKAALEKLNASLDAALEGQKNTLGEALEAQKSSVAAVLEEQKTSVAAALEEQKTSVTAALEEQKTLLGTKLDDCNENVHKECVKVYRNVQAVVVEENGKQTENVVASVNKLKGKMNAVLGVSITAMILALASVVLQVLNLLNFKLF